MRFSHRQSTRSALQASLPASVTACEVRPRHYYSKRSFRRSRLKERALKVAQYLE